MKLTTTEHEPAPGLRPELPSRNGWRRRISFAPQVVALAAPLPDALRPAPPRTPVSGYPRP